MQMPATAETIAQPAEPEPRRRMVAGDPGSFLLFATSTSSRPRMGPVACSRPSASSSRTSRWPTPRAAWPTRWRR